MHRLPLHLVQELHAGTVAGLNLALNMWCSIGTPLFIRNPRKSWNFPTIALEILKYSTLHVVRTFSSINENWHELVTDQPLYAKKNLTIMKFQFLSRFYYKTTSPGKGQWKSYGNYYQVPWRRHWPGVMPYKQPHKIAAASRNTHIPPDLTS